MRLWLALTCAAFVLCGCQHYMQLSSQDFERGHAPRYQFARDNYLCQTQAAVRQSEIGGSDPTGVFNEAYTACMEKRGYRSNAVDLLPF